MGIGKVAQQFQELIAFVCTFFVGASEFKNHVAIARTLATPAIHPHTPIHPHTHTRARTLTLKYFFGVNSKTT